MSQDENQKPSRGLTAKEALAQIRAGTPQNQRSMLQRKNQRMGRATAVFWIKNLENSIQRTNEMLFEKIKKDPGARSQMFRRDLYATERFVVPQEVLKEVTLNDYDESVVPQKIVSLDDLTLTQPRSFEAKTNRLAQPSLPKVNNQIQQQISQKMSQEQQQRGMPPTNRDGSPQLLQRFGLDSQNAKQMGHMEEVIITNPTAPQSFGQQRINPNSQRMNPNMRGR